jgi:hypothetical protein
VLDCQPYLLCKLMNGDLNKVWMRRDCGLQA